MMRRQNQDQQSRVLDELSALVFNLLRSPSTPISQFPVPSTLVRRRMLPGVNTRRVRVVAIRDIVDFDVMWIRYVFYWVLVDALGSWTGYGALCCWDSFYYHHAGPLYSLLRHDSSFSKEDSWSYFWGFWKPCWIEDVFVGRKSPLSFWSKIDKISRTYSLKHIIIHCILSISVHSGKPAF
ncbi:hypothetical protein OIU76_003657 [Salix suchowensis]|nr:hypothetical protein OIU76_003657 [Salix suchowensis]